jgi:lipid A 3-O-deacylase PagL
MILHPTPILVALLLSGAPTAHGQPPFASDADPFAAGRWHAEFAALAAAEAWNYNISREELLGLSQGLTYGLRDGLAVTATQRIYYVAQRANDAWVLGLTTGLRARVYRRGRLSVFADGAFGISDTSIATPPRGTRFNYLLVATAGTLVRVSPGVHVLSGLQLTHVSNNGLKGSSRNPDIEALGISLGVLLKL